VSFRVEISRDFQILVFGNLSVGIFSKIFKKKNTTPKTASNPLERLQRIEEGQNKYGGYLAVVPKVKALKAAGKNKKAIKLLLSAVDLTEAESHYIGGGWGVAPWYYEQLAILYRKEKDYKKEVSILERYAAQQKSIGKGPEKLGERLVKARTLLKKKK